MIFELKLSWVKIDTGGFWCHPPVLARHLDVSLIRVNHINKPPPEIFEGLRLGSPKLMTVLLDTKVSTWLSQNFICFCSFEKWKVKLWSPKLNCKPTLKQIFPGQAWQILTRFIQGQICFMSLRCLFLLIRAI